MTTYHKTNALAAIFYAARVHCPWICYLDKQVDVTTARKLTLQALLRHHVKGPRASAILTVNSLRGHAVDPQITILYRLVKIVGDADQVTRDMVQFAYDNALGAASPCTALAHALRRLGGLLQDGWWMPTTSPPVSLPRHQSQERAQWLHDWRRALKSAITAIAAIHRHEYGDLRRMELNVDQSTQLLRSMPVGKNKTYLELALAGGMLTRECQRHRGPPHIWCPHGCQVPDTEYHRYWDCPSTSNSRPPLPADWEQWPQVTKLTGWSTVNYPVSTDLLIATQRHMINTVKSYTAAHHRSQQRHHPEDLGDNPGPFQDDNDSDGEDDDPTDHDGYERTDDDGGNCDGVGDSYLSLSLHVRADRGARRQPGLPPSQLSSTAGERQLHGGFDDMVERNKEHVILTSTSSKALEHSKASLDAPKSCSVAMHVAGQVPGHVVPSSCSNMGGVWAVRTLSPSFPLRSLRNACCKTQVSTIFRPRGAETRITHCIAIAGHDPLWTPSLRFGASAAVNSLCNPRGPSGTLTLSNCFGFFS